MGLEPTTPRTTNFARVGIPPRRIGAPLGRRKDRQRLEDPADRRCANPVADLEQLTLDPLVSPAVVLGVRPGRRLPTPRPSPGRATPTGFEDRDLGRITAAADGP